MNSFLSEENIASHREYVRVKKLKYSIIESYLPQLSGKGMWDIYRMKIGADDKRDAINLLSEITFHDVFFTSFSSSYYPRSLAIERLYGSEANFLNLIYRRCMSQAYGFVLLYKHRERITVESVLEYSKILNLNTPTLALDVCEHAYFMDYGFDKERYLASMLPYLNLSKLSDDIQ